MNIYILLGTSNFFQSQRCLPKPSQFSCFSSVILSCNVYSFEPATRYPRIIRKRRLYLKISRVKIKSTL